MVYIIVWKGMRLCQDGKWRNHADYGTVSCCVKEYRALWAAIAKAKRHRAQVVGLDEAMGAAIDRTGTIDGHTLSEFVVFDGTVANPRT